MNEVTVMMALSKEVRLYQRNLFLQKESCVMINPRVLVRMSPKSEICNNVTWTTCNYLLDIAFMQ